MEGLVVCVLRAVARRRTPDPDPDNSDGGDRQCGAAQSLRKNLWGYVRGILLCADGRFARPGVGNPPDGEAGTSFPFGNRPRLP